MTEQPVFTFSRYPFIGDDDWRYTFATAQVRVLISEMLSKALLLDMANADSFDTAVDLLSPTQYAIAQTDKALPAVEKMLLDKRTQTRQLFHELIDDEKLAEPLLAREDFANMRLALRRKLTEKPIGTDYSNDGSVPAEQFQEIFETENYSPLPRHMQEAIERAVLAYYQNKDVRQLDYALDDMHFKYKMDKAKQLKNIFALELFRMQTDLNNIRTMLRLKFTESQQRNVFIDGGYVETDRLKNCLDVDYDAIAPLFFATPYYDIVDHGNSYLASNNSYGGTGGNS